MDRIDRAGYARLKQLFLELLELSDAARAQRLTELDAAEPALAQSLRQQLHAAGQPLPMLDRLVDPAQPPRLPRYRILGEIGRGGMGVVWLAERELGDARQTVALKQLGHARWDAEALRRFQRERRILASLDHPNIAALVDGGTDESGQAFLAMQYVQGERLDRWCQARQLDARPRVALMRQIVAAIAYAHGRLVVHRDLKPANILVTADGVPRILDFGIARTADEDAVTSDGASAMTLRYAAPEQVAGAGEEAGVGVDVHALGVILHELLAGGSPHGDTSGVAALMHAVLHETPSPPSRAAQAVPGVDDDLDAICLKAMRKRPDERYADATALLADLDRWLRREPVEARRGERGYRLRSFLRRHRAWLGALALLLVVAVAATAYHLASMRQQLQRITAERDKALALGEYFNELFRHAQPADIERGQTSAQDLLERSVEALREDLHREPAVRATLLVAAARALSHLGRADRAGRVLDDAIALLREGDSGNVDADVLAAAYRAQADARYKSGDLAGARAAIAQTLDLFAAGAASDPDEHVAAVQMAAIYADDAGESDQAREGYLRVVELASARLQQPRAMHSFLSAQYNLALRELNAGQPDACERRLLHGLDMAARHDIAQPDLLLPMKNVLGRALLQQRRLDEARSVLDEVTAAAVAFYGQDDPWLDVISNDYAVLAMLDGRADHAMRLIERNIERSQARYGDDHDSTWIDRGNLAYATLFRGDWETAIRRLQVMLDREQALGRGQARRARAATAALAYAECRNRHDAPSRQRFAATLEDAAIWTGWRSWIREDWRQACLGTSGRDSGS